MMDSSAEACPPPAADASSEAASASASSPAPGHDQQQHPSQPQPQAPHHSAHPNSHHHRNTVMSHHHHEEAEMRESDGDILELGVPHQPGTPVLSPLRPSSSSSVHKRGGGGGKDAGDTNGGPSAAAERLPLLPEAAIVDHKQLSVGLSDVSSASALGESTGGGGGGAGSGSVLPDAPRPADRHYRRCLSGDDAPISTVGESAVVVESEEKAPSPKSVANGTSSFSSSDPTAAAAQQQSGATPSASLSSNLLGDDAQPTTTTTMRDRHLPLLCPSSSSSSSSPQSPLPTARSCRENPAEAIHGPSIVFTPDLHGDDVSDGGDGVGGGGGSGSSHSFSRSHRSKSIDRRLHEAAQFAEAVGEVPPTNEREALKFIIEEDYGGDDGSSADMKAVAEMEAELAWERVEEEVVVEKEKEKQQQLEAARDVSNDDNGVCFREDDIAERGAKLDYASSRSSLGIDDGRQRDGGDMNTASDSAVLDISIQSAGMVTAISPTSEGIVRPPPSEPLDSISPTDDAPRRTETESTATLVGRGSQRRLLCTKPAPSSTSGAGSTHHLTLLRRSNSTSGPNGVVSPSSSQHYVYKGIHSNPPEITKRGITRGNYAQLHRKAWLEVSDKYHRYGKNLRLYYKHWESLGHPTNMFFDWLDSKGEAAGQPLPNLPECPRSELDSDTVLYVMNPEVQERYLLSIVRADEVEGSPEEETDGGSSFSGGDAILVDADGVPVRTGPDGWIFVLRDHNLYGGQKVTSIAGKSKQRFHHSSFFGGKAVAAAGIIITDDSGRLLRLYPHSGHYRPTEAHMQRMLYFLQQGGLDLSTFDVDTQQILHVSRTLRAAPKGGMTDDKTVPKENGNDGEKCKKVHSLHLRPALYVACLLVHKARMIGQGVFSQIHRIRTEGATSVTEALEAVDGGGYWKNVRSAME